MNSTRAFTRWERGSHLATIFSGIAAAIAIFIGIWQWSDQNKQNDLERSIRDEETRPYLTVDSTRVTIFTEGQWEGANAWAYSLSLKNIGVRPAMDVHCLGFLVGGDLTSGGVESFKVVDTTKLEEHIFANPISHDAKGEFSGLNFFGKHRNYFLKVIVIYKDRISSKPYRDLFYYSVNLQDDAKDYTYQDRMQDFDARKIPMIDSLMFRYYGKLSR